MTKKIKVFLWILAVSSLLMFVSFILMIVAAADANRPGRFNPSMGIYYEDHEFIFGEDGAHWMFLLIAGAFLIINIIFAILTMVAVTKSKINRKAEPIIAASLSMVPLFSIATTVLALFSIFSKDKPRSKKESVEKDEEPHILEVARWRRFLGSLINMITLNFLMIGNPIMLYINGKTLGGLALGYKYKERGWAHLMRLWGALLTVGVLYGITFTIFFWVDLALMKHNNGWFWEKWNTTRKEMTK